MKTIFKFLAAWFVFWIIVTGCTELFAQTNGNFKSVRFTPTIDSNTFTPRVASMIVQINGKLYYTSPTLHYYPLAGGGGGSVTVPSAVLKGIAPSTIVAATAGITGVGSGDYKLPTSTLELVDNGMIPNDISKAAANTTILRSLVNIGGAAGTHLHVSKGTFYINDTISVVQPLTIDGDDYTGIYLENQSWIAQTNISKSVFVINAEPVNFHGFGIMNFGVAMGNLPTAGAAIKVRNGKFALRDMSIFDFWNGVEVKGDLNNVDLWIIDHTGIEFINDGIYIRNRTNADVGDWNINNSQLYPKPSVGNVARAGIEWISSGGGKISGNKINGGANALAFGLLFIPGDGNTVDIQIIDNSVENFNISGVDIEPGGTALGNFQVIGNEIFGLSVTGAAVAIKTNNVSPIVVMGNVLGSFGTAPTGLPAVQINSSVSPVISGNNITGFGSDFNIGTSSNPVIQQTVSTVPFTSTADSFVASGVNGGLLAGVGTGSSNPAIVMNAGPTGGNNINFQVAATNQMIFGHSQAGIFAGTAGNNTGRQMYWFDIIASAYRGAFDAAGTFWIGTSNTTGFAHSFTQAGVAKHQSLAGTGTRMVNVAADGTLGSQALPSGSGTVTSVAVSGGTTGITTSGGPITVSGTITLAGTLIAANGGTGFATYAVGDILAANTTTTLSKVADVATTNVLKSGGVGALPVYGKVVLTTDVSGVLPGANGGFTNTAAATEIMASVSTSSAGPSGVFNPSAGNITLGSVAIGNVVHTITTKGTASPASNLVLNSDGSGSEVDASINGTIVAQFQAAQLVLPASYTINGSTGNLTVNGATNLKLTTNNVASGTSAAVTITPGTASGATTSTGNVDISTGIGGATSGNSGNITLTTGTVTSGTVGSVIISTPASAATTVSHLGGNGTAPTVTAGTGAGTTPTISITGTDLSGFVTLTTGTTPLGAGATLFTINFGKSFGVAPHYVDIDPANVNAAGLNSIGQIFPNQSGVTATTAPILTSTTALAAATTYVWYYQINQ